MESVLSADPEGRVGVLSRETLEGTQSSSCCSWILVCLGRKADVPPSLHLRAKTTEQSLGRAVEHGAVVIIGGGNSKASPEVSASLELRELSGVSDLLQKLLDA